jgi:hypothetical protein
VLRRATVVSMVPAAPLLPTTEPVSAAVAHRTGPVATVVAVRPAGVVDVEMIEVEVEADPADADPEVVVGAGAFDEHAPSRPPPRTAATATMATVVALVVLTLLVTAPVWLPPADAGGTRVSSPGRCR